LPDDYKLTIILWDDPILSKECEPVEDGELGHGLEALGKDMLNAILGKGIGLAAPQVGLLKRLIVLKPKNGESIIAVNPCVSPFDEFKVHEEGCLSFPGIYGPVSRRRKCILDYSHVVTGEKVSVQLEGYDAFCAQHEVDHLSGIMFFDKRRMPKYYRKKVLEQWEKSGKR
jgi:peptide deformylase